MRKFTIRFTSPKHHPFPIFSWLIKLFEWWFDASHVQLCWDSKKYNEPLIYEASGLNIHFIGMEYLKEEHWHIEHVFEIEVPEEVYHATVKWCIRHAGLEYDLKGVFGFIWVLINKMFGRKIKNPWGKGTGKQFCSEMFIYILRDVWGHDYPGDANLAGPKAVFKYLYEASKKFDNINYMKGLGRR